MRALLYRSICFSGSLSKTSGPSLPIVAKLGLGRREEVLGLRVVEAASFAGHGPGDPRPLEREPIGGHPVLPARPMRKRRLLRLRVRSSSPPLAHGLERRLVGDANAGRFAQRVGIRI